MDAFLADEGFSELVPKVPALLAMLRDAGRPELLLSLKMDHGVANLSQRQKLANALGRLLREGTIDLGEAPTTESYLGNVLCSDMAGSRIPRHGPHPCHI